MLANGTGQTTDTWTYDAWGETTSRTGVTENDYLYAGERFDRTTELYQLRARYMDPKTGTFLSLDPYQGNRHDPASLHKYMYANANPVNNTDPTGMFSLGETSSSLYVLNIMDGTVGLNYALIFQMMMGAGSAIRLAYSIVDMVTAFFITHNAETFLHAAVNGTLAFIDLYGFCQYETIVRLLVKGLAVYDANNSIKAFRKAVDDGDVAGILMSSLPFVLDVATLFSSCFDGDTPVATETGFRRIDEIRAGDRVWSYNIETGERALKEVKEVLVRENDELLHIETSRGAIDATTSHPFYAVGKGWVAAGDLAVGDSIQAISGDAGVVTSLELEKLDRPIFVYNLDVEDFHSYFVEGVLVHNNCDYKKLHREYEKVHGPIDKKDGWHLHHILYKKGIGGRQQRLVQFGQRILRNVGIDPINGLENLVYAPKVAGQHTYENLKALVSDLWKNRGDYDKVVAVLIEHGRRAVGR